MQLQFNDEEKQEHSQGLGRGGSFNNKGIINKGIKLSYVAAHRLTVQDITWCYFKLFLPDKIINVGTYLKCLF